MNGETYDIYYDSEGDFLEVSFGEAPETEYTEDFDEGIFITKDAKTHEIKSVGILDFIRRKKLLRETLKQLNISMPIEVSFSN